MLLKTSPPPYPPPSRGRVLAGLWDRLFLEQRPSISLGLFRIALAIAIGLHAIPTLLQMQDNYLHTAFREKNFSFFTPIVLEWVEKSPNWLVWAFAAFFLVFWFFSLIGLWTQTSWILMTVGLYYFYAMNSLHIGTLSFDILLVTVFLMCLTPYAGDYFSVDCLRHPNRYAYRRTRPYFLQRLLQLQIASTYFYTGLCKWTAGGNWIRENPFYYLVMSPETSVVKHYPLRAFFALHPDLCYDLGITLMVFEAAMPFLLFIPQTRYAGIALGFAFHVMLVITLHVPTLFFFHFPPQLLLFIDPKKIVGWIDKVRTRNRARGRSLLIYDGSCGFCRASIRPLLAMDMLGALKKLNYHHEKDLAGLHPALNLGACQSQLHLLEPGGKLYGGFGAFRQMTLKLPMLWPFVPIVYLPGMCLLGDGVYRTVANNRYLFHATKACKNNQCFRA